MLLRFGVSNFQSIKDYQEVSLVASSLRDDAADLIPCPTISEGVVPALVLYGANASGKTTMITALMRLSSFVENSHIRGGPNSSIDRDHFALDKNSQALPTQFDCDFVIGEYRYHYGFKISDSSVVGEWLYAFNGPLETLGLNAMTKKKVPNLAAG